VPIAKKTRTKQGYTKGRPCRYVPGHHLAQHNRRAARRTHGASRTPTYKSWEMMVRRCTNPDHDSYPLYGGAGVTVCERWQKFENFLRDMGERPEGTTLSRYGDVGNYEKSNCAWHTRAQQAVERRKKHAGGVR
jgi:hypothetical protein